MTFGVTAQGFNRKLESDINSEIVTEIAPLFGVDPSAENWPNTDSPVSQFIAPFSRQIGIVWELAEIAFQGIDPAQSFGTLLDGLLALNNISRLEAGPTSVKAAISGTEGAVVPAGTRVSVTETEALFEASESATITKAVLLRFDINSASVATIGTPYTVTINGNVVSSGALGGSPTKSSIAYLLQKAINADVLVNALVEAVFYGDVSIQVTTVSNTTAYSVTLNGIVCTYTSDGTATNQEIVDGLVAAINATQESLVATGLTASTFSLAHKTAGSDWSLVYSAGLTIITTTPDGAFAVKSKDLDLEFSGLVDSRMAITKLYTPQVYLSVETGLVEAPSRTLTTIETPVTGFSSVTNFLDGVLGREVESDDEARIRREVTLSTGSAHTQAVLSALNKISGVTLSRAYENISDIVDSDGRPGHSCEFMVQGGLDLTVAQIIWAGRAAGITPYGNINADGTVDVDGDGTGITIKDSNNADQVVHFSRPESLYAFITVVKTLYSEEEFPVSGDDAIAQALLDFGNSMGIGKDFLIQRFIGPAVSVPGVGSVVIQIAVSSDPDDPSPTYVSTNIAVTSRQVLVFDTSRITVS